jgi:PEP-CTERM motif
MNAALRRLVTMCGVVAAMALATQPAWAKATLEAHVVGATCTVTTSEGMATSVPCSADSWVVALQPNWSAQMIATINYTYADDGHALATPQGITIDPPHVRTVFYEAGALYVETSRCSGRGCETNRPWEQYTGWPNSYPPVFISDNDIADSLSGTLTVTTGALNNADNYGINPPVTWSPNIFVALGPLSEFTVSGIPEPSTFVLMLLGLGALGSAALRRSRVIINR